MGLSGETVLITGGSGGIGFALAREFIQAGNEVIVCGRREDKLKEAKSKLPELHTRVCDVTDRRQRQSLWDWVTGTFSEVSVLVNNAGIQQRVNLQHADKEWDYYHEEIEANLEAPIHLSLLFLPHLLQQDKAHIINVTSGLAITPAAFAPVYSATKAALHSFSISLRLQLEYTSVRVIDILPPAVNTDLGGAGLHTFGANVEDFAASVFQRLQRGEVEIGYGDSERRLNAPKEELDQGTKEMWDRFKTSNPDF